MIKQVPKYAKFWKTSSVNKKKLRGNEKIVIGENVSAILQRKLPSKCRDPGSNVYEVDDDYMYYCSTYYGLLRYHFLLM